jgi:hypothetical protein
LPALRDMHERGGRDALAAFSLPAQPSLNSVKIKSPVKAPGLPGAAAAPTAPSAPTVPSAPTPGSVGVGAAKMAANVGMGASTSTDGAGAQAGEPADEGRRQRSVIDRALQRNDDDYATSSMPMPGAVVSP